VSVKYKLVQTVIIVRQ